MSIELMLNAVNLLLVAFSYFSANPAGQLFVFFIMIVAAAEVAVGLAILVMIYRNVKSVDINILNKLKKSYFEKEKVSPSGTFEINAYIKWEKKRILGLYIRNKLGLIYKIKKLIYK
jgi:hypothetical protein